MAKYVRFPVIELPNRQWPNRTIDKAPRWCSVDLRDGNQALINPMTVEEKLDMFFLLVKCGFKEIEVGFPAASETEYLFVRRLIEEGLIPDDVTIQVLTQAREELIKKTIESLVGAKRPIVHLYNSTSPTQRNIVFGLGKIDIVKMAEKGVCWVLGYANGFLSECPQLQYSPESFSATEIDFSLDICSVVMEAWNATPENRVLLNLPATVEVSTPNVFADQIEWFCDHLPNRKSAFIKVHTHNDRGTGVAASELALLAGAEGIEGTLFGNGERTGNADIVTLALNLFVHGINPGLDFTDLEKIREVYECCTNMKVPPRQPYAGELVHTAFSGSHQDAIRKGLKARQEALFYCYDIWDVPYLPIDPADIGRTYKEVIRVNGQSGKGGVAHYLERDFNICLPKQMLVEFGQSAGRKIDALGREVSPAEVKQMFDEDYLTTSPYKLERFHSSESNGVCLCSAQIMFRGRKMDLNGCGNGPIDAFVKAFNDYGGLTIHVVDQSEYALTEGEGASAIAFVKLCVSGKVEVWGAGIDASIQTASIKAILSVLNLCAERLE